jgi:hypothetical protein
MEYRAWRHKEPGSAEHCLTEHQMAHCLTVLFDKQHAMPGQILPVLDHRPASS